MQIRRYALALLLMPLLLNLPFGPALAENPSAACPAPVGTAGHLKTQTSLQGRPGDRPLRQYLVRTQCDQAMPIASVTKMMTAMVILDAKLAMGETIEITKDDRDLIRLTGSRLRVGSALTRRELLTLALMSSENRAALARWDAPTRRQRENSSKAMNRKAKALGMHRQIRRPAAGLDAGNVVCPHDLGRMVFAAMNYPAIRDATTRASMDVQTAEKAWARCISSTPTACCATTIGKSRSARPVISTRPAAAW